MDFTISNEKIKLKDIKVGEVFLLVVGNEKVPFLKVKRLDGSTEYVNLKSAFIVKSIDYASIEKPKSAILNIK